MALDTSGFPLPPDARTWTFIEGFVAEPEAARIARQASTEIGAATVTPAEGAALRGLALASQARHIVELGTGTGAATIWLTNGLAEGGQITSLDADGEHHRLAREHFAIAGISGEVRLINGKPLEVIERLTAAAYDLVVVNLAATDLARSLEPTLRLLRTGGQLVITNTLAAGKTADPAQRDADSIARRQFVSALGVDPRLQSWILPAGNGILVANYRGH